MPDAIPDATLLISRLGNQLRIRDLHGNGDNGNTAVTVDLPR